MAQPSIRLIAEQIGLSKSAVSLALRSHPSIPLATRQKVEEVARRLGYRLNPLVAALMAQQRGGHSAEGAPLIVFVDYYGASPTPAANNPEEKLGREASEHLERAAELAGAAAKQHGYQLDYLKARSAGMTPARLAEIIKSRGAQGIIFLMPPGTPTVWKSDWSEYCVVELGGLDSRFHQVLSNQFATSRRLIAELMRLGYRRPGLAMPASNDEPGRFCRIAFNEYYSALPARRRLNGFLAREWHKDSFLKWWHDEKPDVVVGSDLAPLRWLREAGVKVPKDTGFVCLDLLPQHRAVSAGMDSRQDVRIKAAMTVLDGLLRHNERGAVAVPLCTTVCGEWIEGSSVRAQ